MINNNQLYWFKMVYELHEEHNTQLYLNIIDCTSH